MSLNALISMALPDGSLKNIVLCSPISPLNLMVGLIIKSMFLSFIRNKNSSNSSIPRAESNHRHEDFQSSALPTELPGHKTSDKVFIIKFN